MAKAKRIASVEVDPCNWKRSAEPKSTRHWEATGKQVQALVDRSELPKRRYVLRVMRKHRGNGRPKGDLKVMRVEGHTVLLSSKPGDNDSVWSYCLMVPHELDPEGVQQALMKANGQTEMLEDAGDHGQPTGVPDVADRVANPQPDSNVVVTAPGERGSAGHFLKGLQEVQEILDAAEGQQNRLAELEDNATGMRDAIAELKAELEDLQKQLDANEAEQLRLMEDLANDESFKMATMLRDQLGRMFLGKIRPQANGVNGHG